MSRAFYIFLGRSLSLKLPSRSGGVCKTFVSLPNLGPAAVWRRVWTAQRLARGAGGSLVVCYPLLAKRFRGSGWSVASIFACLKALLVGSASPLQVVFWRSLAQISVCEPSRFQNAVCLPRLDGEPCAFSAVRAAAKRPGHAACASWPRFGFSLSLARRPLARAKVFCSPQELADACLRAPTGAAQAVPPGAGPRPAALERVPEDFRAGFRAGLPWHGRGGVFAQRGGPARMNRRALPLLRP